MTTPSLYGTAELADALGWTPGKVAVYLKRARLPEPVARLRCGPIWTREQVEALLRPAAVDADNNASPLAPPPVPHGIRPGRVFLHRRVRCPDGRPRRYVVVAVDGDTIRFAALRLDMPKPVRHTERVALGASVAEHLARWVEETPQTAGAHAAKPGALPG